MYEAVDIRERIRVCETEEYRNSLNYTISVFANRPWTDYFTSLDATKNLLKILCPGWITIGDWIVGNYFSAWIGNAETGQIMESSKVSDPVTVSLLTLVLETHIYILSQCAERVQTGHLEEVKIFLDNEFRSTYIGSIYEH